VKGLFDPVGDINLAVTSKPKLQIISNSWGYSADTPGASLTDPYLIALEAAVASAVAKGIIVCFSAGNGHYGFPGSPYCRSAACTSTTTRPRRRLDRRDDLAERGNRLVEYRSPSSRRRHRVRTQLEITRLLVPRSAGARRFTPDMTEHRRVEEHAARIP